MGYYLGKGGSTLLKNAIKQKQTTGSIKGASTVQNPSAQTVGGMWTPSGAVINPPSGSMLETLFGKMAGIPGNEPTVPLTGIGGTATTSAAQQVQPEIGNWTFPPELVDLYKMVSGNAGKLLNMEPGFTQPVIDAMFGKNFENIRGAERGTRNEMLDLMAAQGMAGTGTETEALRKIAGDTERNVGGAKRDVFLANEAQKRADLELYNTLAQKLFESAQGFKTTEEALNAQRRMEANAMLNAMLQFYLGGAGG